jgi:DNA topoisomerase-2
MSKKIEDKYKILSHIDHILLRPQTYVGSNKIRNEQRWLVDKDKMTKSEVSYIPSFIKIFDEVITNSIDESKRNKKLNRIDVCVDKDKISIKDNGGIPVVKHKEYKIYVPEVIFGNLMSGTNYDDTEERTVAGVNGLGSKLTNIFSTEFSVSTCDGKKCFKQKFENNMRVKGKPSVKKGIKKHTHIEFKPDLEKFGMKDINNDHYKIIEKRVYDLAACNPKVKIYFNGKQVKIDSFENYISLYVSDYLYESNKGNEWEVGVALSEDGFEQISFVNSTETYDGGTHVDYVMNQIITELRAYFNKKHKFDVKPSELKQHMLLLLNCTIINPSFSSQTKEKLITEVKDFGQEFVVSKKLINSILKSEIVNSVLDWIEQKKQADENKLQRKVNKNLSKIKVEKLIDSKGKDRIKHSLGLYEGDCLSEDTNIRVIRDGDITDVKIKDANVDDLVITHNNTFSSIYSMTKKIKKKSIIKTKDIELVSSKEHEWYVYDTELNEFYFEKTINIDKNKHKLVKNYLAFIESLLVIVYSDGSTIKLDSGDVIDTNDNHSLAVYDKIENKFKMCRAIDIDISKHLLVNIFRL